MEDQPIIEVAAIWIVYPSIRARHPSAGQAPGHKRDDLGSGPAAPGEKVWSARKTERNTLVAYSKIHDIA